MPSGRSIVAAAAARAFAPVAIIGVLVVCAATPAMASAAAYQLSAFAGTGAGGLPTAGPATNSKLDGPEGVTADALGDVYIADSDNNEVEKITASGQLSVIAGNGSPGVPTPGAATSSELDDPTGVAVDAAGDVYIADNENAVVEKVTPSGNLSIFAGNGSQTGTAVAGPVTATTTTIGKPWGVAVDSSGNVYISACLSACRIFKVTPSGMLSIFAGNGTDGAPTAGAATSSDLGDPLQLAVDGAGDLFAADYSQNVIEKITALGTLSIVAGTGTYGTQVSGPATSSALRGPYGIAVDAAGDLYIADTLNYDVEEVSPNGTLSVIAGEDGYGTPTYGVPATSSALPDVRAIASTPSGRLYIAETLANRIDVLAPPVPANLTPPAVSGAAVVGGTLTATTGTWSNIPTVYAYQWEDCDSSGANCTPTAGATGNTHVITSGEAGQTIRVIVTAENAGGSVTATSAQTGAVPSAPATPPAPTATPKTGSGTVAPRVSVARVKLSRRGDFTLLLRCKGDESCDADVKLAIRRFPSRRGAAAMQTVARSGWLRVAAAGTRDLKMKLSAATLRKLRVRDSRRIQVTLRITTADGTQIKRMWLHLPVPA